MRFTIEDLQRKGYHVDINSKEVQHRGEVAVKSSKPNKIRNAQKQEVDGVKAASKLELYMYNLLAAVKIPFFFQHTIELQPGFSYNGKAIRPITMIVDFYLPEFNLIADTKGWQLADNKLKFKMLKHKLFKEGKSTSIELPATKEECGALVNEILSIKKPR